MPQIPVYDQKVGLEGGGTPTPQLSGMSESASGVNVAEALGGLGKAVDRAADSAAHIVAYKQRLDSQEKVDNLTEQAAAEWQDRAHGEGGWLTRQGDAAKGITAGTFKQGFVGPVDPSKGGIKYQDSFDGFSGSLKEKYMAQASTEFERRALNHSLDTHQRVYRNAVISHEAQQMKVARQQASEASIEALRNTGINAATVGDLQHVTDAAMDERERALRNEGHHDDAVINAVRMKTADEFAEATVHANLDSDPEAAQVLLDGIKDRTSNGVAAQLQNRIDGKMIAIRSDTINNQIADDPASRNVDGTFNLGYVEQKAADLASERPVHEREQLVKMAKQQALMADAALAQQQQKARMGVQDGYAELRDKGVPFNEAEKMIVNKYGGLFGPGEVDKLREDGVRIYQRDPEAIKNRLKLMNDDQQSGYLDARNIIISKYKLTKANLLEGDENKMSPGRIMLRQLDAAAPSKSGAQIREWINAQLKDVPTKDSWLGMISDSLKSVGPGQGKKAAWQEQRSLEARFSADKIEAARADIMRAKRGRLPTYVELEKKLSGK